MVIKVTIGNQEVRDPLARFIIALIVLAIIFIVFVLLLFLLLPFIWFVGSSIIVLVMALSLFAPALTSRYRALPRKDKSLEHKE
jgi:ABC-type bacteriocin/lantibiotic exporter with double-glycine peptidase domain